MVDGRSDTRSSGCIERAGPTTSKLLADVCDTAAFYLCSYLDDPLRVGIWAADRHTFYIVFTRLRGLKCDGHTRH